MSSGLIESRQQRRLLLATAFANTSRVNYGRPGNEGPRLMTET